MERRKGQSNAARTTEYSIFFVPLILFVMENSLKWLLTMFHQKLYHTEESLGFPKTPISI